MQEPVTSEILPGTDIPIHLGTRIPTIHTQETTLLTIVILDLMGHGIHLEFQEM
jgi:hypothetical protein